MTKYDIEFLQNHLDVIKYYRSEEAERDLSGKMDYCSDCHVRRWTDADGFICTASQDDRKNKCLCAFNYLMIEENNKKK